jgi:glycosyltransferase involved in cell wall biosynthesis
MDISLIICTRNRCQQLGCCLQAVQAISFERPWELIVVDNGSTDETAALVDEFSRMASFPVVYVLEPKPGKSNGLNTALGVARGQILAFTDDDCYPASDFLSQTWSCFEDASLGYITGRIMLHDPADAPMAINESTTPLEFPGRSFIPLGAVGGGNMAFRRQALLDVSGFDPMLGPGSMFAAAEDLDVAGRASAVGWKGQYRPEIIVRHHHGRKGSQLALSRKFYGIGLGAYHMKVLLKVHEFSWFSQIIYQIPQRYRYSRRMLLWELVGAAKYTYTHTQDLVRRRFGVTTF